jgi:hypothetical protein
MGIFANAFRHAAAMTAHEIAHDIMDAEKKKNQLASAVEQDFDFVSKPEDNAEADFEEAAEHRNKLLNSLKVMVLLSSHSSNIVNLMRDYTMVTLWISNDSISYSGYKTTKGDDGEFTTTHNEISGFEFPIQLSQSEHYLFSLKVFMGTVNQYSFDTIEMPLYYKANINEDDDVHNVQIWTIPLADDEP